MLLGLLAVSAELFAVTWFFGRESLNCCLLRRCLCALVLGLGSSWVLRPGAGRYAQRRRSASRASEGRSAMCSNAHAAAVTSARVASRRSTQKRASHRNA